MSCKVSVLATPNEDDREFQQKKSLGSIKGGDVISGSVDSCYTFSSVIAREFRGTLDTSVGEGCLNTPGLET